MYHMKFVELSYKMLKNRVCVGKSGITTPSHKLAFSAIQLVKVCIPGRQKEPHL